jgi:hypothetical protein
MSDVTAEERFGRWYRVWQKRVCSEVRPFSHRTMLRSPLHPDCWEYNCVRLASACVAVGADASEIWNGSAWSLQAAPAPTGSQFSNLDAISCTEPTACMAVGAYTNAAFDLVGYSEQWNGTDYSTQTIPLPGGAQGSLNRVSCMSATVCVAVGDFYVSGGLVEVWNGTGWSQESTPSSIPPRTTPPRRRSLP